MPTAPTLRAALSAEIARYFRAHLDEELAKPPEILDKEHFDGRSARDIAQDVRARVVARFPRAATAAAPGWNLYRRWAERDGQVSYDRFSFEAYHLIFLARLEDLAEGSDESRSRFLDTTWRVFSRYDHRAKGFSVAFFLDSENNMREFLRRIAVEAGDLDADAAAELLVEQSRAFQMTVHRFFDTVLQRSLAENAMLLDNVLPRAIQDELKRQGRVDPVLHPRVAVLFSDFAGFTDRAARVPARELVADLNALFGAFDETVTRHGCDRIKTVGDAYVAVCGMPAAVEDPATPLLRAAFDLLEDVRRHNGTRPDPWRARIGLHLGPVIGAVVGVKRYIYDVFGDTVNIAARMEQMSEPMRVHVTDAIASTAGPAFRFESRDGLEVKGKGRLRSYWALPAEGYGVR
jgi:class 3 adenylate cyclase